MTQDREEIKHVYAIVGPEAFLKRAKLKEIARGVAAHGSDEGATHCDGKDKNCELASVLDEVRTYSLLGGLRFVVVDDADKFITRYRKPLEEYCAAPVDSGVLVLVCKSLPANTRLYKAITRVGTVIKCEALKGRAVETWIAQHARADYGKQMDARTCALLRELTGDDLGALDGELGKLALFVRDRPRITTEDIEALVGRHRADLVFGVIDAMADGNAARALALWEQILATDRAAPERAVGGLAWGVRRLLSLKQQVDAGASAESLSRQAFTQPGILRKRLARASAAGLQAQLCDLLEADIAAKTGLSVVGSAVEKFIIKHSQRGVTSRQSA